MSEPYLVFYRGVQELCAYTLRGSFDGEVADTVALLASERGIPASAIRVAVEQRSGHKGGTARSELASVRERMKAAGYDPALAENAACLDDRGTMACESIELRTYRCRPNFYCAEMLAVEAIAVVPFTDGSKRPYPHGWPAFREASVVAYFELPANG